MNRIQFWVLIGLSSLVSLLLILHIILGHLAGYEQARYSQAQQIVSQGQASQAILKQLAVRIFQDSQKTGDQGLKDLMTRQEISYKPGTETNAADTATPAPAPTTH